MSRPTPTALKILRNNPGKRPIQAGEPEPTILTAPPKAPAHIKKAARKTWNALTARLCKTGLLTEDDLYILEIICIYRQKLIELAKNGETLNASEMGQYRIALEAFGGSPAARTKIKVSGAKESDKEAELFGAA